MVNIKEDFHELITKHEYRSLIYKDEELDGTTFNSLEYTVDKVSKGMYYVTLTVFGINNLLNSKGYSSEQIDNLCAKILEREKVQVESIKTFLGMSRDRGREVTYLLLRDGFTIPDSKLELLTYNLPIKDMIDAVEESNYNIMSISRATPSTNLEDESYEDFMYVNEDLPKMLTMFMKDKG